MFFMALLQILMFDCPILIIYYCYFIVAHYMSLILKFQLNDNKLQIKPITRIWSTAPNTE